MKYALKNVKILNGHADMQAETGKAILIDGNNIADIVSENEIPSGYTVNDMNGAYVLPGLINMHIHIPASGKPKKKKMDYEKVAKLLRFGVVRSVIRKVCEGSVKTQLLSGTTTVRAVGGVLDFDTKLRDKINSGKVKGPRILAADWAVSVPGGHMTGSVALPAHSVDEAVSMVKELATHKPDLIKLMITGGVLDADVPGEPGVLKMPAEYVKAACEEAHKLGFKVAAHVESNEGMRVALEGGVDTLEHGGKPSPELIEMMKEKGSVLICTLSPAIPFAVMDKSVTGMSDMDLLNGKALYSNMVECVKECLKNGVTVGLGTDTGCPYITHYDTWRELWYYTKCIGVSNAFAIHTATEINAKIAGIENETGTIEAGKSADLLIVKENPLENIEALREPYAVVFRGEMINEPKVKKFAKVEEALDAVMKAL